MFLWHRTGVLRALALCALLTCAVLATACGSSKTSGSSTTSAQTTGGVSRTTSATLRVAAWENWTELVAAAEQFRKLYPNVSFKFQQVAQPYFDNLPQTLTSSDVPDVTAVQLQAGPWRDVLSQHLVADLSDVWNADGLHAAYASGTVDNAFDGRTPVAIPMHSVWAPVIYYNRSVFERLGITPPAGPVATTQEFDAIVAKLRSAGLVPLAPAGIQDDNGAAFLLGNLLQTSCGDTAYNNLISNWQSKVPATTKWTSPCALAAIQQIKGWADSGVFGSSPATMTLAASRTLFAAGRAGMTASGSWEALSPTWRANIPIGWFLAPPADDAAEQTTKFQVTQGDGLTVPSGSPHLALSKAFVQFVASRGFQESAAYLRAPGASPRTDVSAPPGTPALAAEQQTARGRLGDVSLMLNVPYGADVFPELARMIAGERTVAQVAAKFQADSDQQRARS